MFNFLRRNTFVEDFSIPFRVTQENLADGGVIIRIVDEDGITVADFTACQHFEDYSPYVDEETLERIQGQEIYQGSIHSYQKGLGRPVWKYGELTFILRKKHAFRIIIDLSPEGWTPEVLPEVLDYLSSKGVNTEIIWEGTILHNAAWIVELSL